jgi:hypothetical protein
MTTPTLKISLPLLMLCGAFATSPTWAVPTTDRAELAELAARNRQERAICMKLEDTARRGECLQDADAAYAHAKRNRPSDIAPSSYAANALKRCETLAGDDRRDCIARMAGQGTTSGSAAEGGIYRELVVIEVGAVPVVPPAAVRPPMTAPVAPAAPAAPVTPPPAATSTATPAVPGAPVTPAVPSAPASSATPNPSNPPAPK